MTTSAPTAGQGLSATYVTDIVAWNGRLVAIGRSDNLATAEGGVQRVWISDDGEAWAEQGADFGSGVSLVGLGVMPDGRLLAVGYVLADVAVGPPPFRSLGWVSEDATTWRPMELPIAEGVEVSSFADGPVGYALTARNDVWFSPNGVGWSMTRRDVRTVHAGEQGFVGIDAGDDGGSHRVVASADGETWLGSGPLGEGVIDVTALGPDWLATSFDEGTIAVWRSVDGLRWERVLDVNDLTGPDGPKAGLGMESGITGALLSSTDDVATLTLSWNHCCAQLPVGLGTWISRDGRTWQQAIEGDAVVEAAATLPDGTTVLGGFLRRGVEAAFWIEP